MTAFRSRALLASGAALAVLLAACGSETESATSATSTTAADASGCELESVTVRNIPPAIATRPEATVTPADAAATKLQKIDVIVGEGPEIKSGDCVAMNYVGVLAADGRPFDASWDHGGQLQVAIGTGEVISGWDQGIPGMRVGGRRKLVIPSDLAYGPQGSPPRIPPNATLVFVVDAVRVGPPPEPCQTRSFDLPPPPEAIAQKPQVPVTPQDANATQLQVSDLVVGTGAEARPGDCLQVQYVGVLGASGEQFDASWDSNRPFQFELGAGEVIPGWDQGVAGMKVGGRRRIVVPPALGYGAQGSPPKIPPNATLVFVVDLVGQQSAQ